MLAEQDSLTGVIQTHHRQTPVTAVACTWYQYFSNVVCYWVYIHSARLFILLLLPLNSQPNSTNRGMFFISLLYTQVINAVFHPLQRMNSIRKWFSPTSHPLALPACFLFIASLVPILLTSFPPRAEVLGWGGAGQGALHARAGEVPEDRSLQAFQKEGPGEAEGQAHQGRWGRLKQQMMKPARREIGSKQELSGMLI